MWNLKHLKNGCTYCILVGEEYAVGRKDAHILIEKDPSISRKHAVLYVTHSSENLSDPSKLPVLKIKDAGSKYGTFKNEDKISGEDEILCNGDTVKFGQFESIFRVCYSPLVVTASCLETSKKKELKKSIQQLGGHFVQEWRPSCTHLIMSDIKITIKAVCCLISQKPLILPEYLVNLVEHIKLKVPEPSVDKYLPPVSEPLIDKKKARFDNVPERKGIFKNKTFVFLDKSQFKKLYCSITIGGGDAIHMSEHDEIKHDLLLRPGICVVQPQVEDFKLSQCNPYIRDIYDILNRNGKRMIPEADFGLAVVYCSTEVFCNPDSDIESSTIGLSKLYSQSLTQQEINIPDSLSGSMSSMEPFGQNNANVSTASAKGTSETDLSNLSACNKKRKLEEPDKKWIIISSVDSNPRDTHDCDSSGPPSKVKKANEFFGKSRASKQNNSVKGSLEICKEIPMPSAAVKVEPSWTMDIEEKSEASESCAIFTNLSTSSLRMPNVAKRNPLSNSQLRKNSTNETIKVPVRSSLVSTKDQGNFLCSRNVSLEPSPPDNAEDNQPRNLIKIAYMDLVCITRQHKTNARVVNNEVDPSMKNFKCFRKVLPALARILPRIIGGHELEAYSKQSTKSCIFNDFEEKHTMDVLDDYSVNVEDECKGEFDWESQA